MSWPVTLRDPFSPVALPGALILLAVPHGCWKKLLALVTEFDPPGVISGMHSVVCFAAGSSG